MTHAFPGPSQCCPRSRRGRRSGMTTSSKVISSTCYLPQFAKRQASMAPLCPEAEPSSVRTLVPKTGSAVLRRCWQCSRLNWAAPGAIATDAAPSIRSGPRWLAPSGLIMVRTEYRHVHEHSSTNLTLVADFRRSLGASYRGDKGQLRPRIAVRLSNNGNLQRFNPPVAALPNGHLDDLAQHRRRADRQTRRIGRGTNGQVDRMGHVAMARITRQGRDARCSH
jgi:hypothetical protein